MFDGEYESLKAIHETNTVKVPQPIRVLSDSKHGSMLVMEYLEGLSGFRGVGAKLGQELAQLHLHRNEDVSQFGFNIPTCCGSIPQSNNWTSNWPVCVAPNPFFSA